MKDEDTLSTPEQRLLHGLLADLHHPPIPAGLPVSRPRISFGLRVAAALLFMGVGLVAGALFQTRLPEAQAVLNRASAIVQERNDRQYRVKIEALKDSTTDTVGSGMIHVRGAEAFAIRFEAIFAKGWYGSDGKETWFLPTDGAVLRWPAGDAGWKDSNKLPFARFDAFLMKSNGRYDVVTLGREGGDLRVRATRRLEVVGENISLFEIWVDEASGVMRKLRYRMDPELWHWEPWIVTIEHAGDAPHAADFYSPDARR